MNIAAFQFRQWVIALSGLVCGMTAAFLVH